MKERKKTKELRTEGYSLYFVLICVISVVSLLISNITSVKLFSIWKIILPSSALLFPISYIVGDIIAEVYGYKKAKFVILLGFACNAFMVLFFTLTIKLPASVTWDGQNAFAQTLGTTPRLFIASFVAFLAGSLSNAYVMDVIKKLTKGKKLWMRTIGSTLVGEALDTLLFVFFAFSGIVSFDVMLTMIICQFIWKVSYEVIATPFTYFAINKYKKLESEYFK